MVVVNSSITHFLVSHLIFYVVGVDPLEVRDWLSGGRGCLEADGGLEEPCGRQRQRPPRRRCSQRFRPEYSGPR